MDGEDPNIAGFGAPQPGDQIPPAAPGEGGEEGENVDQFYDDGGETFLPADHVSYRFITRVWRSTV